MTEQTKTAEEIYSRDGIMIYQNGFRIAECENEEAADQILQALSQLSSPQEVSDEVIYSEAVSWALSTAKEDNDTLLIIRYEAY